MRVPANLGDGRVTDAGADVLGISETSVTVVVDDLLLEAPFETLASPGWIVHRALEAMGFRGVELREFGALLPPASGAARDVVLYLGRLPGLLESLPLPGAENAARFSVSWDGDAITMRSRGSCPAPEEEHPSWPMTDAPLLPLGRIAAGLALQEAIIVGGRLASAAPPDAVVSFAARASAAPGRGEESREPRLPIEGALVDVIGAGAVGTNVLETLAPLLGAGCELRIVDFDQVGPENLAIQPAFSAADLGRPKALAIAEALAPLCDPELRLRPLVMRYEECRDLALPSLRIACPDSFQARKYVSDLARADRVPLVEGGISPLAAQVRSYVPGRTACLDHRIRGLARRAALEREPAGCARQRDHTLPGTAMVCGGLLVLEAMKTLQPEWLGWPSPGTLTYDTRFPQRFGVVDRRPPCTH